MSMNEGQKHLLFDAIKNRVPLTAHFVCFVQEGELDGTLIGTMSIPQVIDFLEGTLRSLIGKNQQSHE
jgi:hypothetical protein